MTTATINTEPPTTSGVSGLFGRLGDDAWLLFALRRGLRLLVSLWVLVTASFFMIHLIPGDPVRAALGAQAPQALVDARRHALGPGHLPAGCAFAARCPLADDRCRAEDPPLVADRAGQRIACWHPADPMAATGPDAPERRGVRSEAVS